MGTLVGCLCGGVEAVGATASGEQPPSHYLRQEQEQEQGLGLVLVLV